MASDKAYSWRNLRAGTTALLILLLSSSASAAALTVDDNGGANYTRIQDAIGDASAGDMILVYSGSYYENVDLNKQLILKGIDNGGGKPVIEAHRNRSAITLSAGNSTLEGFILNNSGLEYVGSSYTSDSDAMHPSIVVPRVIHAGIYVNSNNNMIRNNTALNNYFGIYLDYSNNNTLSGNNASDNSFGIEIDFSSNNTLTNNTMKGNKYNFRLHGSSDTDFDNLIDESNLAVGRPIYYIKGAANTVYDSSTNASSFYCIKCINVTIKEMDLNKNYAGVFFWNTTGSSILNTSAVNNYNGAILYYSSNNTLNGNNATNNAYGIILDSSSNNALIGNDVSNTNGSSNGGIILGSSSNNRLISNIALRNREGIYLSSSDNNLLNSNIASDNVIGFYLSNSNNNSLSDNTASSNSYRGISLFYSTDNTLSSNNVSSNYVGILLLESSNNKLSDNTVESNSYGADLSYSNNNYIYNNFFKNTNNFWSNSINNWNISKAPGINIIGGSYLGGNVWANPNGTGFSQVCRDSDIDGICDSPYVLDANNIDHMPLAYPELLSPVSAPESRYVWDAALGANLTYTWTPMNFDGLFYDVDNNVGNESLRVKLDNYADRTIDIGDLVYTTTTEEVGFMYPAFGKYQVIGFMGEKYFAAYTAGTSKDITSSPISPISSKQLHKILMDDDTRRAVYEGSTLTLSDGYVLKVKDVDITGGKIVLVSLLKDGNEVDTTAISAGSTYVYSKRVGTVSEFPIIAVHIDTVFAGREANAAFLKGIFQISESFTSINTGNKYGIMEITGVSSAGISMRNANQIDLIRGSTIDIMGYLKFKVADSEILRFYPINFYNIYYYYGDYSSDYERRGSVFTGSNNITAWDALNFAGFWYDLDTGSYSETLKIANLSGRVIQEGSLDYISSAIRLPYIVTQRTGKTPDFTDGTYAAIGFGGDKHAAIKGKTSKLSKILLEQGTSTSDKKTLTIGETWDMGGGYTIKAQSIDAKASPRQAWLVLSRNGVKLDDKVVAQGSVYTYVQKSFAGETDVPLLVTYIDSIFAGATSDMVQLRYTWLVSDNVTEIKAGDKIGVFNVTKVEPASIVLENDNSITLGAGSTAELMGNLKFNVADAPELRFYPSKVFTTIPLPSISKGSVIRSISPSIVQPDSMLVITLIPSPGAVFDFPGYQVVETIPPGFTFVSTSAGIYTSQGNLYTFTQFGSASIIYTLRSSSVNGTYRITGTFKDEDRNTGTVSGMISIRVGRIQKNEAVQAVLDYFDGKITKAEAIDVVLAYFAG